MTFYGVSVDLLSVFLSCLRSMPNIILRDLLAAAITRCFHKWSLLTITTRYIDSVFVLRVPFELYKMNDTSRVSGWVEVPHNF